MERSRVQRLVARLALAIGLFAGLFACLPDSALAQDEPPALPPPVEPAGPGARLDADGNLVADAGTTMQDAAAQDAETPAATGGPDEYGYTWNDSVPFNWIDATGGTDTGMSGYSRDQRVGPIPLPFPFKYYEGSYNALYIAASGYVAFQDANVWPTQVDTPSPVLPNTVISPYSTPLDLATKGKKSRVFYSTGGTAPNRYFVVAWNEVRYSDEDDLYTFEVLLHENGDIQFQYKTMTYGADGNRYCGYIGIEDAEGLVGLQHSRCSVIAANKAIRFTRPAATARVRISPRGQGAFTRAGSSEFFRVNVTNNGELGSDTYKVTLNSPWPAQVLRSGGIPLSDTDGDGVADTGPLGQGQSMQLLVRVQTPAVAAVADNNSATLLLQSTRNSGWQRQTVLRTTVPAPFAQVYEDAASWGVRVKFSGPQGASTRQLTQIRSDGGMVVSALPSGGQVVVWSEWSNGVGSIRYLILDPNGAPVTSVRTVLPADGKPLPGWAYGLSISTAPDGLTGLAWVQAEVRDNNGVDEMRQNLYWATLDKAGNQIVPPTNITGNTRFAPYNAEQQPSIYMAKVAASADGRFFLAWENDMVQNGYWVYDIYYTVRDAANTVIKPATLFSATDTLGHRRAEVPILKALATNHFLLGYYDGRNAADILLAEFTGDGALAAGAFPLGIRYGNPQDIVQLSNGSILLVWTKWEVSRYNLYYAVLNGFTYSPLAAPTRLENPASITGDYYATVAALPNGRAVVGWGEYSWNFRRARYYALLDQNGAVLTPATPFLAARTPANSSVTPSIYTGDYGNAIAADRSLDPTSATLPDVRVMAPALGTGAPGGAAQLALGVNNRGLIAAGSVVITAQLDSQLTFVAADPAPATVEAAASPDGSAAATIVRWELPSLNYLSQGRILLTTGVPTATIGATFPVTVTVTHAGADFDDGNMTARTEVMAADLIFTPLIVNGEE